MARNITMTEAKKWGIRWELSRKRLMKTANKKGIDLSRIKIVPDAEPNVVVEKVYPWETVAQAVERERKEKEIARLREERND